MMARFRGWCPLLIALCLAGCHELNFSNMFDREAAQEEKRQKDVMGALNGEEGYSRMIGDYVRIFDAGTVKVEAVGLVQGLEGRGENPPASYLRTMLKDELLRQKVDDVESLLASSDTCLVIVTAYIPAVIDKNAPLDVEIALPSGASTKSLVGGVLHPCFLREHMTADGLREGRELVIAHGPILVNALGDKNQGNAGQLRGRVPSGGKYIGEDRVMFIGVGSEYRSARMTRQIATSIGTRYHDYNKHGIQVPMAEPKTDAGIELLIHPRYRDNPARYLQCIRHIAVRENDVERHMRMQQLAEDIQHGPTAESAAIQLEAIGLEAVPALQGGLKSADLEARFHAAVALAYLGNADGVAALKEAIDQEPAFRIYAFAALATLEDGTAVQALMELMNHDSTETRYGAFRTLHTMAPQDPAVAGLELGKGAYRLHAVRSSARPLVHLTRYRQCEIVVFGRDQTILSPTVLRAGDHILIQDAPQANQIIVKRISRGDMREKTVDRRLVNVLRAVAELGASYPDIVQMLVQAEQHRNLEGGIAIDELPRPGRAYTRPDQSGDVQVGGAATAPELFAVGEDTPPVPGSGLPIDAGPAAPVPAALPPEAAANATEMFAN